MPDYLPPGIGIPAGLIIAAYVLLSEKQRWGRFLVSELRKLGALMKNPKPHKCGECFNPFLEAGNEECPNVAKERAEQVRAMRESRARFQAALDAELKNEGAA